MCKKVFAIYETPYYGVKEGYHPFPRTILFIFEDYSKAVKALSEYAKLLSSTHTYMQYTRVRDNLYEAQVIDTSAVGMYDAVSIGITDFALK